MEVLSVRTCKKIDAKFSLNFGKDYLYLKDKACGTNSMKLNIKRFDKSYIGTFSSFFIPLIVLLQISLPGVALCIGSDGHTSLESYSEGLCNEITSNPESLNNSTFSLEALNNSYSQHCGSCIDIPISDKNTEYKVISSNDLMPEIDIHQFVVYQLTPQESFEISSNHLIIQKLPYNVSFLDSLHTTVITC